MISIVFNSVPQRSIGFRSVQGVTDVPQYSGGILQYFKVFRSVPQYSAVCHSVTQHSAVFCSFPQCSVGFRSIQGVTECSRVFLSVLER